MLPNPADGSAPGYFGVYPAIVTDLVDTQGLGRVEVRYPFLGTDGNDDVRAWATLCSPYADADQGLAILPEKDSQVVVAFEAGDPRRPYVIGAAWHGSAALPLDAAAANNIRVLKSREKSRVEFDDTKSKPKVTISTASGHVVVLDAGTADEVTIQHAKGCVVKLTATAVEVTANASVTVDAPMVTVKAPVATFTGNIVCQQSVIAGSFVVSPAYTPGVGNLL
jgi:uncharacterized protein involved in type VI secretion and phage assembly